MPEPQYQNVYLDFHLYQCFDDGSRGQSPEGHYGITCGYQQTLLSQQTLPTFVGEWSVCFKQPSDTAATEPFPTPGKWK